jgi:hypothetical protein
MPATVRHIVVIRDTPLLGRPNLPCVRRALAAHRSAARTCAVARAVALAPDPEVTAARRMHSARVQVVDVSEFMCDRRRRSSAAGGAVVITLTRLFGVAGALRAAAGQRAEPDVARVAAAASTSAPTTWLSSSASGCHWTRARSGGRELDRPASSSDADKPVAT